MLPVKILAKRAVPILGTALTAMEIVVALHKTYKKVRKK